MKVHTNNYKNEIRLLGKQLDSKITYGNIELGNSDLNSITPIFQSDILKSCMKQLEIESRIDIPLETEINLQFGCLVGENYEYLDFGNYIVYSSERIEDLNAYKIIAYDKMLYSMVDYVDLGITYPITIRDYINAIATHLGLTFANANDTFANYDKEIPHELYLNADGDSIGYTFRDVLDELAQVTASTICINQNNELEIRYINDTNDTINESYFKDINVTFGEKFGPVNSIVLARANSDKIYLQDSESVEQNGPCEICINDNQIMNFDDRNTYLQDILEQLNGLEYYLNDYSSTGITYYDVCDKYNVSIGENVYPCIMFNDEINITQGLEEFVYTRMPKESETDYKKADKQDRINNQTKLVVDKHNQEISTLITYVGDRSEKQTSLTQDVDGLISEVSNIPKVTIERSGYGSVTLENLANTKLGMLKVHPTNNIDIIRNIASTHLKVRIGNKVGHRGVTFESGEEFEILLPTNLYYLDNETYDEYVVDGVEEKTYVIHRVGWNNGVKYKLTTPTIEEFTYQEIMVDEGNLVVSYNDYPSAYIYIKAMKKNEFTDSFASKLELKSLIEQTANSIGLSVQEFKEGELVSSATILEQINNDESSVQIDADKISLDGKTIDLTSETINIDSTNFKVDTTGKITATSGDIGGFAMDNTSFKKELKGIYNYSVEDLLLAYQIYKNTMNPYTNINYVYDYNNSGSIELADVSKINSIIQEISTNDREIEGTFEINSNNPKECLVFKDEYGNIITTIGLGGLNSDYVNTKNFICGTQESNSTDLNGCIINGNDGTIIVKDSSSGAYTKIEPGKITLHDSNGDKIITTTN